jgi:hypothetical protein
MVGGPLDLEMERVVLREHRVSFLTYYGYLGLMDEVTTTVNRFSDQVMGEYYITHHLHLLTNFVWCDSLFLKHYKPGVEPRMTNLSTRTRGIRFQFSFEFPQQEMPISPVYLEKTF